MIRKFSSLFSLFLSNDALIFKNSQHTGSVRGLSFNPFQSNLMASAAGNGEASSKDSDVINAALEN